MSQSYKGSLRALGPDSGVCTSRSCCRVLNHFVKKLSDLLSHKTSKRIWYNNGINFATCLQKYPLYGLKTLINVGLEWWLEISGLLNNRPWCLGHGGVNTIARWAPKYSAVWRPVGPGSDLFFSDLYFLYIHFTFHVNNICVNKT